MKSSSDHHASKILFYTATADTAVSREVKEIQIPLEVMRLSALKRSLDSCAQ
jgi:hypothetical protein